MDEKLAHAVRERWPPASITVTSGRRKVTKEDLTENGPSFAKRTRRTTS
ncbi:hypothetical protein [Methylobacterium aerolatum]|uniref:Transposase n=1 Tax=Methylobacterium aerolatum TaxID=418708 RepID=A0ABU0I2G8_9HYPH|nr:hypothetical protein [Methylobacterium aerolatum]MDQ0448788.1 hypothetical protein [Methylobacterium aerolatum]